MDIAHSARRQNGATRRGPRATRAAQNGERTGTPPDASDRRASHPAQGDSRDPDRLADPLTARTGDPPDATRPRRPATPDADTPDAHGARDRQRRISADRQDTASRA
ncbi:hypothetical protein SEA_GUYFAGIERI_80 [Rhodococcus phage GuyFagieri]|nr:hypothetical protein SEA_GUYFAGIERI_80 [Rhodococcus phage GuyFagieri]